MTKKILMVCLGNICRSPIAAGILRKKLPFRWASVDSAGTTSYHSGEGPDKRALMTARKHGVDISGHRARCFKSGDFDFYDMIYVMDHENYEDVISLCRNKEDKDKVRFITDILFPGKRIPVPDPYYGNEDGFEKTFNFLDQCCESIAEMIKKKMAASNNPVTDEN